MNSCNFREILVAIALPLLLVNSTTIKAEGIVDFMPAIIAAASQGATFDNDSDSYSVNQGDCNDNNNSIYPSATEICGDGIDQDCSGNDSDLGCVVTVKSAGQVWLDRNLGASRVATSSVDSEAYGDLYQWGRFADGHEKRTSFTTSILSSTDVPGHGYFILDSSYPYDWRKSKNNNLWQGEGGTNNPCPSGFRLPTDAEFNTERASWSGNNSAGAFESPLKLVMSGRRFSDGSDSSRLAGSYGGYWTSTVDGTYTSGSGLYFNSSSAYPYYAGRANGFSVRCIKD